MSSLAGFARAALAAAVLVASACADDDGASGAAEGAPAVASVEAEPDGVVERVIDGDSVELRIAGDLVEARLVGINAPELADCQGPAARDELVALAEGAGVGVQDLGSDRFGRLLVDLTIDGESVNLAMVRAGWALGQHTDEHDAADEWVDAMTRAADAGGGMWGPLEECPPADDALAIAAIELDPPGPDGDVLEDEWIELENRGVEPVDLTGWAVRDESTSNRFTFGGGTLEPGDRLRLRTGCGTDRGEDRYWCAPAGVWSNRGETALLLGPSGSIEDWRFLG